MRHAFGVKELAQAAFEVGAERFEALKARTLVELAELGEAGSHGQRVAAEGAGLVDGTEGSEVVHDLRAAAEGADRQATTDDFAEATQIRREVFEPLNARLAESEAGHHLVENEQRAMFSGDGRKSCEVAGLGENQAGIGGVGLDDDGGDFLSTSSEKCFECFGVVVGQDDRFFGKRLGHAGGVGFAVGERA